MIIAVNIILLFYFIIINKSIKVFLSYHFAPPEIRNSIIVNFLLSKFQLTFVLNEFQSD